MNEDYIKFISDNLDNNIKYTEYLAKYVGNSIAYTEYISENLDPIYVPTVLEIRRKKLDKIIKRING